MGFFLPFLLSFACAAVTEKPTLAFPVDPLALATEEVQLFSVVLAAGQLAVEFPEAAVLDARRFARMGGKVGLAKAAYVVKRSVGFFSDQQFENQEWLKALGWSGGEVFVDSDDLSNVQDARVIHAMSQTKKLDPVSGGAFSTVTIIKKDAQGAPADLVFFNHMPVSGSQTLVVLYRLRRLEAGKTAQDWKADLMKEVPTLRAKTQPH
jgi:hypothetical protein